MTYEISDESKSKITIVEMCSSSNNSRTMFMVLTQESLWEFTRFTRWMQNSTRWLPIFGPSQWTWAVGPPVGST